jgi:hypothetical protein
MKARSGEIAPLKAKAFVTPAVPECKTAGVAASRSNPYQRTCENVPLLMVCWVQNADLPKLGSMACTARVLRASEVSSTCVAPLWLAEVGIV